MRLIAVFGYPSRRIRRSLLQAALLAGALTGTPVAEAASQPRPLLTGFTDQAAYQAAPDLRAEALRRTKNVRGSVIRITVSWLQIARTRPPMTSDARNPGWRGYDWGNLDAVVRDVHGAGLRPLVSFTSAPRWAEGPGRPPIGRDAPPGSWRPSDAAYRLFAEAAARRYSGRFPDPANPAIRLPRVKYWQAWNEPNLTNFISPQWVREGDRYRAASPGIYRKLLNAFYAGIKKVARSNVVVAAGTAPYGEPRAGERRMPPALFARYLLCVRGRVAPKSVKCPAGPVYFDAYAHHPYPISSPDRPGNPDDVVIADLWKLTRPLRRAEKSEVVRPRGRKQFWATEFSWDTSPPDPDGVPVNTQALYVASAFYLMWKQGVDVAVWYLLRDEAEGRGWAFGLQSGVFFREPGDAFGSAKPSSTAFRFPFTAYRRGTRNELWGLAPGRGRVTIEAFRQGSWVPVKQLLARSNRVFVGYERFPAGTDLRARWGAETSLTWRTR